MTSLLTASVPAPAPAVNLPVVAAIKPQTVETVTTCTECWLDTSSVLCFFGRELCPDCYDQEALAFCEMNAPGEFDDWASLESDRLDKLGDVLQGMECLDALLKA